MGKGSAPRPIEIDRKKFEDNWDKVFGKKDKKDKDKKPEKSTHPQDPCS